MISTLGDSMLNDIDIIQHHDMIDPFNTEQVQPVSYDVLLGDSYKRLRGAEPRGIPLPRNITRPSESDWESYEHVNEIRIRAHEFLLASTLETVHIPTRVVARLEGKSTIARQGLIVHAAGLIDPGFHGQITLELHNETNTELILPVGTRIGQLTFIHLVEAPMHAYGDKALNSHYQGQTGATAPRGGTHVES